MSATEIEKAIKQVGRRIYLTLRFLFRRFAFIRNGRDAIAIMRKGIGLLRPS